MEVDEPLAQQLLNPGADVFANYDVLSLICEHIAIAAEPPRLARDLLSLAVSCKAGFAPAMNLVWKRLTLETGLMPLLKVFPNFVQNDGQYSFQGPITPEMLERFDLYASRVQHIMSPLLPPNTSVDPAAFVYLGHLRRPLLPNLRFYLATNRSRLEIEFQRLFLLISPTLENLYLDNICPGDETKVSYFLSSLSASAPTLRSLSISGAITPNVIACLPSFRSLRHIGFRRVLSVGEEASFNVLPFLKSLTSLESLTFLSNVMPASDAVDEPTVFNALRVFSFNVLSDGRSPISLIRAPQLEKITVISADGNLTSDGFRICLSQCALFTHLKKFVIRNVSSSILNDCMPILFPLKLQDIELSGFLSEQTLSRAIDFGSWRNHRRLRLQSLSYRQGDQHFVPSIACLSLFAMHCPLLTDLSLTIKVDGGHEKAMQDTIKTLPPSLHKLEYLSLRRHSDTPLVNAYELAVTVSRYIDHLFPYTKEVTCLAKFTEDVRWLESIKAMLKGYQKARAEGLAGRVDYSTIQNIRHRS